MRLVIRFLFFLVCVVPSESTILKLAEDLFTGQFTTANGEVLYFGMEKTGAQNWAGFVSDMYGAKSQAEELVKDFIFECVKPFSDYGFGSSTEFSEFTKNIQGKSDLELKKIYRSIRGLNESLGFISFGGYIVYASKTPITKKLPYITLENEASLSSLFKAHGNILMIVGSRDFSNDSFENRGIFRNPLSFIEGTYQGISLLLHAFSALARRTFLNADLKFLKISPVTSMQSILYSKLGPSKLFYQTSNCADPIIVNGGSYCDYSNHKCYLTWVNCGRNMLAFASEVGDYIYECHEPKIWIKIEDLLAETSMRAQ